MWKNPPQNFKLGKNEIHIWLINSENFTQNLAFFSQILSPEESSRAKKYKFTYLQENFTINRGFLRFILAKYLGIKSNQIELAYNHKGKPFLASSHQSKIKFNLSHKNQYTIYGISDHDLGLDLEEIKHDIKAEDIAKRFFTNEEYREICQLREESKREYFFQLWTAKEAYLKAIGEGLSGGLNSINLHKSTDEQIWALKIANLSSAENQMWQIMTFAVMNNYLASLAIKTENNLNIKYYSLNSLF